MVRRIGCRQFLISIITLLLTFALSPVEAEDSRAKIIGMKSSGKLTKTYRHFGPFGRLPRPRV